MLKINKILSKKIQFYMSLRGLFPFCHSRESGNPSSLSLRGTKQRSNLKGFSLIELMVAVVILAIGVVGIFLAFSNAWMGMANARDRTVATNYAREAMENIKNMDFELVTNGLLGIPEDVGAKFTRVIIVDDTESANLKKIDTKVSWTNRQNQDVSVETSMYINRTIFNPGEATHIVLYADPYYTVLPDPEKGVADIIAVIKDINNTTVIDWTGGVISFSIISELQPPDAGDGTLPANPHVVTPTNGTAQTTFTGTEEGDVVIRASVDLPNGGGTISDTITITVTSGAVRIKLSAPDSIDVGGSISTITAELVNSFDETVVTATNDITFNISGNGTFVNPADPAEGEDVTEITLTPPFPPSVPGGTATIDVRSSDTPGVAIVTASSEVLLSDSVNITITGGATSISVSVDPDLIYTDNEVGAEVTLIIQDVNENPVEFNGVITLSTSPEGTGLFCINSLYSNPCSFTFDSIDPPYITYYSSSSGFINIIASGDGSISGNTDIEVREALIADTITLKADPKNILADGTKVSKITATIKQGFTVISNYNRDITFEIILDTSNLQDALLLFSGSEYGIDVYPPLTLEGVDYDSDGEAVVDLKPASEVGICTVKVSTENSEGTLIENTIEVGFYSGEHRIELIAVQSKMLVNGDTCKVTATVVDEEGTPVDAYEEDITFTILAGWPKTAKFAATGTSSLTITLEDGVADVILIPQSTAGTVVLKASSFTDITDITGYLNIPVVTTPLELAPEPNIIYDENQVSFDIEVHDISEVETGISLVQMQVSWSDNIDLEFLNIIEIGGSEVYPSGAGAGVVSGTVVDTVVTLLPIGIHTINLYFDGFAVMAGKTFNIIFNPSSESYPVEFEVPST